MTYKALVIGDLHISDRYSGKHVDYWQNCIDVLDMLTAEIVSGGYTHLFLLGDIVGMTDKNMRTRDGLLYLMMTLQKWGTAVNGNLYSVRGNHDIGGKMTDFDMFVSLGLLKLADSVDLGCLRVHLINYGDETREIEAFSKTGVNRFDIALMHANLQVEGKTTWFRADTGYELSTLTNLKGVEAIVCGHIHNTSPLTVTTSIGDKDVSLIYPGCPTRPKAEKNIWETTMGIILDVDDVACDVSMGVHTFNLKPSAELFKKAVEEYDGDLTEDTDTLEIGVLSQILEELSNYNVGAGVLDYKGKIRQLAGLDADAAQLAIEYVEQVEVDLK